MNQLKSIFPMFSMVLAMLLLHSCSQDTELLESSIDLETNVSTRSKGDLDAPEINGDLLKFRDVDHFTEYYQNLQKIFDENDQELLGAIFNSSEFNSVYTNLMEDEFADPSDAYRPFLTDPIMMTIANLYFEFQIGDMLVTYMNNEEILTSDINDVNVRSQIRNMPKGERLDVKSIPEGAFWGEDDNIEALFAWWCGCEIKIEQISCNEVRIFGKCKNALFSDGEGTVSIFVSNSPNFPPSTATPFRVDQVDGNFEIILSVTNIPALFIHASADPDCLFGNTKTATLGFDANMSVCDPNERTTPWTWVENNGQAILHRTYYYKNFWFSYEGAKVISGAWNIPAQKWTRNSANLRVTIDAIRKNSACTPFDSDADTNSCSNCSSKAVSVILLGSAHHCDGDVTGVFRKIKSGIVINAVGEVDFECCE